MLPDYLAPNLDIVFVGINPGDYSDRVGHYFARKTNGFWMALNESRLAPRPLTPDDDARLPEFRLGLTDLVKRPSRNAGDVSGAEFVQGGQELKAKLVPLEPRVICFVGLAGYRQAFDRHAELGLQAERWGHSHLFIVPSTSARNAYYRSEIINWFRRLKKYLDELKGVERC